MEDRQHKPVTHGYQRTCVSNCSVLQSRWKYTVVKAWEVVVGMNVRQDQR